MNKVVSEKLFERACEVMPGGVNSPVRSGKAVGASPIFVSRAEGAYIWDEDGNKFIDYVCSWGPLILGHAHPDVVNAICKTAKKGTSYGIPTRLEVEMAELVAHMVPSIEMVRFVNSGTEATMSALRLARGFTGRSKIIKFTGCYHGHSDCLLVSSGSGVATLGIPGCPGVPESFVSSTISIPYNDIDAVQSIMNQVGDDVAAIIVEPVAGNMGVVPPQEGFLEGLREVCDRWKCLLIFDEVITGFRLSPGGAQQLFKVIPDITCLGKIIGGGLPVGAYGGKADIMKHIAPVGSIYQAGTLSGNPLAMAAGLTTLKILQDDALYRELEEKGAYLEQGLRNVASKVGLPVTFQRVGSMGCGFFTDSPVKNFEDAQKCDTDAYALFWNTMLNEGIYLAPSQFEAFFISTAHSYNDLDKTIEAAEKSLRKILESRQR